MSILGEVKVETFSFDFRNLLLYGRQSLPYMLGKWGQFGVEMGFLVSYLQVC